ncbi:hypothetical protein [Paenibacillus sp. CMAA1364]
MTYNSTTLDTEVIQSLQIGIMVINPQGSIIAVNPALDKLSTRYHIPLSFQWIGVNFFQCCEAIPRIQEHENTIMDSFQLMFNGHIDSFTHEYSYTIDNHTEWFTCLICPLLNNDTNDIKGAVISFTNISSTKQLESEFLQSVSHIRTLHGLIAICAVCKRIHEDDVWNDIEPFLEKHTHAEFTHDICPDCIRRLYPRYSSVVDRPFES